MMPVVPVTREGQLELAAEADFAKDVQNLKMGIRRVSPLELDS